MMAKSLDLLLAERRVGDPRVTFVRSFADDGYMTPEKRIPGERGHTIERLNDGPRTASRGSRTSPPTRASAERARLDDRRQVDRRARTAAPAVAYDDEREATVCVTTLVKTSTRPASNW